MKPRILVIGSVQADFCLDVSRFPEKGEELLDSGKREYRPGGCGAVAAVTFSRLGADTLFCGKTGNDTEGARLKQSFMRYGIDTRFLTPSRSRPTDFAIVVSEESGGMRRIRFPGASATLTAEETEEAFTTYPDSVFLQLDVPAVSVGTAVKFAKKQNIPIVVDSSPAVSNAAIDQIAKYGPVDIFITDAKKAEDITGIEPTSADNCLKASLALSSIVKANHYVIKLGTRGAFIYDNTYYKIIPTYNSEIVDMTAAGDAFSAALAWQYTASADTVYAVKYASAVASLVISKKGGIDSIPSVNEVNVFINGGSNV
ncbi:MAG: hypothetical protein IKT70_01285 [Clostridia bacterium]|nr:hypothetical protein [Clostridia bacterium]